MCSEIKLMTDLKGNAMMQVNQCNNINLSLTSTPGDAWPHFKYHCIRVCITLYISYYKGMKELNKCIFSLLSNNHQSLSIMQHEARTNQAGWIGTEAAHIPRVMLSGVQSSPNPPFTENMSCSETSDAYQWWPQRDHKTCRTHLSPLTRLSESLSSLVKRSLSSPLSWFSCNEDWGYR